MIRHNKETSIISIVIMGIELSLNYTSIMAYSEIISSLDSLSSPAVAVTIGVVLMIYCIHSRVGKTTRWDEQQD